MYVNERVHVHLQGHSGMNPGPGFLTPCFVDALAVYPISSVPPLPYFANTPSAHHTDDDINEGVAFPFPRAERHNPSLLSSDNLAAYNGSNVRRTWVEGQWASSRRPKGERKRSLLANTLIIVFIVAAVPLIACYLKYGQHLATFGDHTSMLPWLAPPPPVPTRRAADAPTGSATSRGGRGDDREGGVVVTRADEQRPWLRASQSASTAGEKLSSIKEGKDSSEYREGKEGWQSAVRAVEQAENALSAGRQRFSGGKGQGRTRVKQESGTRVKYLAAEREVRALRGKVQALERKVSLQHPTTNTLPPTPYPLPPTASP
jgi:hypothetical protein